MKKAILFIAFLLILTNCSSDEDTVNVTGRIERALNGAGIPNQRVSISMYQIRGTGPWSFDTEIDQKEVTTDANGNFSVAMTNAPHTFVRIFKWVDDNYPESQATFSLDEDIVLSINKFIKFKIFVNNTNPFNEADFVHIDFHSGLEQNFRYGIENFGAQNVQYPADGNISAFEDTSWHGTNVNSVVYYNVPENAEKHKIVYNTTKNGIQTSSFTDEIPFQPDVVNEYHFDY